MHSVSQIPRDSYLGHSLSFKPIEIDIRKSIMDWIPTNIIDAHAHCNLSEHLCGLDDETYKHMVSTFPYFSLEESKYFHKIFFPGKNIRSLRFALPFFGLDTRQANDYLLDESPKDDRVALVIAPGYTEYAYMMIDHPRVSAVKMYYKHCNPWAQTVYECFSPDILELIQDRGVPIILHAPKMLIESCSEIIQLVNDFPDLNVVIAHLGSHKLPKQELFETYRKLAVYPQIYMDTAMNPSPEIVKMALDIFGSNRIMFGTDEPVHMIRSALYKNPELGERLITDFPYHWVVQQEYAQYGHLATGAIHAIWQSLLAIHETLKDNYLQETIKQKLFHDNAKDLFGF